MVTGGGLQVDIVWMVRSGCDAHGCRVDRVVGTSQVEEQRGPLLDGSSKWT